MASLSLQQVGKSYAGGVGVVHDVSLEIADGEFCVFVGPSGCGKSTLLRMIAGLEDITSGELRIGGERVNERAPAERNVAMVFQSYALYPHMDVAQNLGFGLHLAGASKAQLAERTREVARLLQIEHLLTRKPKDLSGGQRQRVAIGRALVRDPGVFLFDEPLSNLDAALRHQTRLEIARLHRAHGRASTVYVTHDQVEAMTLADRMVLLQPLPPGQLQPSVAQSGPPMTLYRRPRNLIVAGFLGSPRMNFLPAQVLAVTPGGEAGRVALRLPAGHTLTVPVRGRVPSVGDAVTLGLRPEHATLHTGATAPSALYRLPARVRWLEHLGDQSLAYLQGPAGETDLVVRVPDGQAPALGDALHLGLPLAHLHLFDRIGDALEVAADAPIEAPFDLAEITP